MNEKKLLGMFLSDPAQWRRWRATHSQQSVGFLHADFSNHELPGAYLDGVNLYGANFSRANLRGASLQGAHCHGCNFRHANLTDARMLEANLQNAVLDGCTLVRAKLVDTTLIGASFVGADLTQARLEKARMVGTDLTNARLTGARVYGLSAWDVCLDGAIQDNLVVCKDLLPTPHPAPALIADSLELAQFLYLMMNNQKLRHVIETITSKVVLILGRFDEKHMTVLNDLRQCLRDRGFLPVLFDFSKPASRDLTETVSLLGHMARFIVADISAPRSVPQELTAMIPRLLSVPVQPLLDESEQPYSMFADLERYPQVLPIKRYGATVSAELLNDVIEASDRVSGGHTATE